MHYDPPRQLKPEAPKNPLEVDLVYNVRQCGTCSFFWPENPADQPYGPYSSYDLNSNTPATKDPKQISTVPFIWVKGTTRPPAFPDAEVMDGCRKAPIMTIGINPNLSAFGPGTTGASWCYPSFSDNGGTNSAAKYAYYYRYRSVYQERFDLKFVRQYLMDQGRVSASKDGTLVDAPRTSENPAYDIHVVYDGDTTPTAIHLPGKLGGPVYVVLFDTFAPNNRFKKGDVIAAPLSVPAGKAVDVYDQPISYYMQIVPVLQAFTAYLISKGHADAGLRVGEDVGQLDMVACASPHWGAPWLGGTTQSMNTVISNCVHKNAWALKQLIQTRPAVLFLVGQASWNMFQKAYGGHIKSSVTIPNYPEDGPYTLLRLTTQNNVQLAFSTKIGNASYSISTRLVVTPHFSYAVNFMPQFRFSPAGLAAFSSANAAAAAFLHNDTRLQVEKLAGGFAGFGIKTDAKAVLQEIQQKFPTAYLELMQVYYDPHQIMADFLGGLYDQGSLAYTKPAGGQPGYLTRSDGPCTFCDNALWSFPLGCPYGKPKEQQFQVGFLEKVAEAMMAGTG